MHFHLHQPEPDPSAEVLDDSAADSGGTQNDENNIPVPDHQINLIYVKILIECVHQNRLQTKWTVNALARLQTY